MSTTQEITEALRISRAAVQELTARAPDLADSIDDTPDDDLLADHDAAELVGAAADLTADLEKLAEALCTLCERITHKRITADRRRRDTN